MSRAEIILRHILHNWRVALRHWSGRVGDYSGSSAGEPAETRAENIRRVFENYLCRGGISREELRGAQVLEIGPGDCLGVARLFAQAGAARVIALDKFRYDYETERNREVYRLLGVAGAVPAVETVFGAGIEEARLEPASFDLIVSNAVLEECPHPDRAFANMDRALRRGGRMLHQIDLSDYGIFTRYGFSPLEFLTVPEPLYRRMTRSCGGPNRRWVNFYRDKMSQLGYAATIRVTHRYELPPAAVEAIRPRLLAAYRELAAEDLLIWWIFLAARRV